MCAAFSLFFNKEIGVAKREQRLPNPRRDFNIILLKSKEMHRATDFREAAMRKLFNFSEKKMGQLSGLYSYDKFPADIFDLYDLGSSHGTDQQAALFTATKKNKGHLVSDHKSFSSSENS